MLVLLSWVSPSLLLKSYFSHYAILANFSKLEISQMKSSGETSHKNLVKMKTFSFQCETGKIIGSPDHAVWTTEFDVTNDRINLIRFCGRGVMRWTTYILTTWWTHRNPRLFDEMVLWHCVCNLSQEQAVAEDEYQRKAFVCSPRGFIHNRTKPHYFQKRQTTAKS